MAENRIVVTVASEHVLFNAYCAVAYAFLTAIGGSMWVAIGVGIAIILVRGRRRDVYCWEMVHANVCLSIV